MPTPPTIVRLNSQTMPMNDIARETLALLAPRLIEIEGGSDAEILAAAREADAIMIVSAYLHAPVIRELKSCRIISRIGTGVDKIDIAEATRQGGE